MSLFFIDEVSKYRKYDEFGNELNSTYGDIFEQEYKSILKHFINNSKNEDYIEYLKDIDIDQTHKGYFSIDKKTNKLIDPSTKRNNNESDDVSAYDLILKDKERLLSFNEPTRFIFSHSALREGWDNPNIFQICTLKYSDSDISRHQEVGRGLRLSVNEDGERMDYSILNNAVHEINKLTIIANESYESFTSNLQKDIREKIYNRPLYANKEFFTSKIININGQKHTITSNEATAIYRYLLKNDYIDNNDKITQSYKDDLANNSLVELPADISSLKSGMITLIESIFDESILETMYENGQMPRIDYSTLNDNFYKKEFQELWNRINKKYSYRVDFDSNELIKNAVNKLDEELHITSLMYTVTSGVQGKALDRIDLTSKTAFGVSERSTHFIHNLEVDTLKYDIVGNLAKSTFLSRSTIVKILKNIKKETFDMFSVNPEDFLNKASRIINEQKSTLIVERITYNMVDDEFDVDIFTAERVNANLINTVNSKKHIKDVVLLDGSKENSIERKFVKELELANEVSVYAKLPSGFFISTPMGRYTPDWAIAFYEGTVKHIYFIAETKGSLSTLQLRKMEDMKIESAKVLFNGLLKDKVTFGTVDSYKSLLDIINK